MFRAPLSVTEVTDHVSHLLDDDEVLSDVWIVGEVQESTVSRSGHIFFSLCDGDCMISAVMFRSNAIRQKLHPTSGSSCVAHGHISIYPREGAYRFYVDLIQDAGVGLAALEIELLRQQLQAEGLFDESRKRPIPVSPACIGVVTSPGGAVWHDIQTVVQRRNPFTLLVLSPASVQGETAAESLHSALQALIDDERPSVIIIARGGGSAADLSAFNDEKLIRSVFASPIPVVSAVGHETDCTLLDLVSDLRAPTPSAAAELCTAPVVNLLRQAELSLAIARARFRREIATATVSLSQLVDAMSRRGPAAAIKRHRESLSVLQITSIKICLASLGTRGASWHRANQLLSAAGFRRVERSRRSADLQAALLGAISPPQTLRRGYAFINDPQTGQPVLSVSEITSGQPIQALLVDGAIQSTVTSITRSDRHRNEPKGYG